jgi:hypothetical protein
VTVNIPIQELTIAYDLKQERIVLVKKVVVDKTGKRRMCDTETAKLRAKHNVGEFGDPKGYEESLYVTRTKIWFVHGRGGCESPYATGEDIRIVDANYAAHALDNIWE